MRSLRTHHILILLLSFSFVACSGHSIKRYPAEIERDWDDYDKESKKSCNLRKITLLQRMNPMRIRTWWKNRARAHFKGVGPKNFSKTYFKKFSKEFLAIDKKYEDVIKSLSGENLVKFQKQIAAEKADLLVGKEVKFEQAMAYTFSFLPPEKQKSFYTTFVEKTNMLKNFNIKESKSLPTDQSYYNYTFRGGNKVMWSSKKIESYKDLNDMLYNMMDIYTSVQYNAMKRFNFLYKNPANLTYRNTDLIADKIMHLHYLNTHGIPYKAQKRPWFPTFAKWMPTFAKFGDHLSQALSLRSMQILSNVAPTEQFVKYYLKHGEAKFKKMLLKRFGPTVTLQWFSEAHITYQTVLGVILMYAYLPDLYSGMNQFADETKVTLKNEEELKQADEVFKTMIEEMEDTFKRVIGNLRADGNEEEVKQWLSIMQKELDEQKSADDDQSLFSKFLNMFASVSEVSD